MFTNINVISESLCLIVAISQFRWLKNSVWGLFIPFLAITLAVEIIATFFASSSNGALYNSYMLVQFLFTSIFFYKVNEVPAFRYIIVACTVGVFIFSIMLFVFWDSFKNWNDILFTVNCFFTVLFGLFYLLYCINENDLTKVRHQDPALWASFGIIIFFSIVSIVFNAGKLVNMEHLTIGGRYLDDLIAQILSVFMYGCFAYAFIIWRNIQTT